MNTWVLNLTNEVRSDCAAFHKHQLKIMLDELPMNLRALKNAVLVPHLVS